MSAERISRRPLRLAGTDREDAISTSLRALVTALRMPESESESIREELESHLRERVHDLEIAGMAEDDAVRCAAAELGDVPRLAQRYREARAFPRRRLIMNLSMFAVGGAALVVGVAALTQAEGSGRVAVFTPPAPTAQERATLSRTVQAEFKDVPVADVFSFVSQSMGVPVNVAWSSLPGVEPDTRVSFVEKNADLRTIIGEVADDIGAGTEWTLDYRLVDGTLRIGSQEYFDRKEMVLASYDLSAFADSVAGEEVGKLIKTFVNSSGWEDNGGTLARLSLVGDRMFVEAPKRYHVQIQWFIDELSKKPGHTAAQPAPTETTGSAGEVLFLRAVREQMAKSAGTGAP